MTTALNKHNYNIFLSNEFAVNSSQIRNQYDPRVTVLEDSVVVSWTSVDQSGKKLVYKKQLESFTSQEEVSLVSTKGKLEGYTPSIDSLYGNHAITFTGSKLNQDKTNIYAQLYGKTDSVLKQEFKLDNTRNKQNYHSDIAMLYNGEIAAVWTSNDKNKWKKQEIFGCTTKNKGNNNKDRFNCDIEKYLMVIPNATLTCNQYKHYEYNYIFDCVKLFQKFDNTVSTFECSLQDIQSIKTKRFRNGRDDDNDREENRKAKIESYKKGRKKYDKDKNKNKFDRDNDDDDNRDYGDDKDDDHDGYAKDNRDIDKKNIFQCSLDQKNKCRHKPDKGGYNCVKVNPKQSELGDNKEFLDFRVNSFRYKNHNEPKIAALYPDKFIIVWVNNYNSKQYVSAQAFYDSGKRFGKEFRVSQSEDDQDEPSVSGLHNGQFVVSWNSISTKNNNEKEVRVFAQIFNADLTRIGSAYQVNPHFFPYQHSSRVKALYDNSFVISWLHEGKFSGIYLQRYSVTGRSLGPELRIHTHHIDNVTEYDIGSFRNGTMFAVWSDNVLTTNKNYNIYGKYFLMPTQTATISLSDSETESQTQSDTESLSHTATSSTSDTNTESQSLSKSFSISDTKTESTSVTLSDSKSDTETQSLSETNSQSFTPSSSKTESNSPSSTETLSQSVSQSHSLSNTESNSNTISDTSSDTKSGIRSLSATDSKSESTTNSESSSLSESISSTETNSLSSTSSLSVTGTGSATISESQSKTSTKSETATETRSTSSSHSPTFTKSVSVTKRITNTQSAEVTNTQSSSVTNNITISPTFTDTVSIPLSREIKPLFSRVLNIDDPNIGTAYGSIESEQFIIFSQIKNLSIISNGGPNKFTLYPSVNSTVTVLDFSVGSIIDLTNIPNLNFFDQLSFRKGSCIVEIRYSQKFIIKNHDCNVISEGNFILPSNCIKGQECITNELKFRPIYSYLYQTSGREAPVNVPGTSGNDQFFISGTVSKIEINSGGGIDKYTISPALSNPRITSITDFTADSIIDMTQFNSVKALSHLPVLRNFPYTIELSSFSHEQLVFQNRHSNEITDNNFLFISSCKKGPECPVNTYKYYYQKNPSTTWLTNGGYVIVWEGFGQDGSVEGIFGQLFNSDGTRNGIEFSVNTKIEGAQINPKVTSLKNNGFVVAWNDRNNTISCQRFNGDAAKLGDEAPIQVLSDFIYTVHELSISSTLDNYAVVWTYKAYKSDSFDSTSPSIFNFLGQGIFIQKFDAEGHHIGNPIQKRNLFQGTSLQNFMLNPDIILFDNNYVIAWDEYQNSKPEIRNVYVERLSFNGTKIDDTILVSKVGSLYQKNAKICGFKNGNFVVAWEARGENQVENIHGRLFARNGQKISSEFYINTNQTNVQINPTLSCLDNGYFAAAWQSYGQDGSVEGVYAQAFSNKARKLGYEILINDQTYNAQSHPVITTLKNQETVFAWQSNKQNSSSYNIFYKQVKFIHPITETRSESITDTQESSNTKTNSASLSFNDTITKSSSLSSEISSTNTLLHSDTDSAALSQSATNNLSASISLEKSNTETLLQTKTQELTASNSGSITPSNPCVKELLKRNTHTLQVGSNLLLSKITYFPDKSSVLLWSEADVSGCNIAVRDKCTVTLMMRHFTQGYSQTGILREVVSDPYITWVDIAPIDNDNFVVAWAVSNITSNKYTISTKVLAREILGDPSIDLSQTVTIGEASQYQSGIFRMSSDDKGYTIGFMANRGKVQLYQFNQANIKLRNITKYLCNYATSFDLWAYDQTIKLALGYFDSNGIDLLTYNSGIESSLTHIDSYNVNKVLLEVEQGGNTIVAWQEKFDCSNNPHQIKAFAQIFHSDNTTSKTQISIPNTGPSVMTSIKLIENNYYIASFLSSNEIQINFFNSDILIHSYQENHNNKNYLSLTPVISKNTNEFALDCNTASIMALYGNKNTATGTLLEVIYETQAIQQQSAVRNAEIMELNTNSNAHYVEPFTHDLLNSNLGNNDVLGNNDLGIN